MSLSFLLLIFFVSTFAAVPSQQQRSGLVEDHLKRAQSLFAKGNWAGAIASYDEAIKLAPERAEIYLKRGLVFRMQGSLNKAIADFDKATELNPRTTQNERAVAGAYTNHGQIQLNNLLPEDAIVDFEKALKIYPAELMAYFNRGEARILIEDFVGAIADFDTYLAKQKMDPFNRALAQGDRGLAKHFLGREAEAKKDLTEPLGTLPASTQDEVLRHIGEHEVQLMILRKMRMEKKTTMRDADLLVTKTRFS